MELGYNNHLLDQRNQQLLHHKYPLEHFSKKQHLRKREINKTENVTARKYVSDRSGRRYSSVN